MRRESSSAGKNLEYYHLAAGMLCFSLLLWTAQLGERQDGEYLVSFVFCFFYSLFTCWGIFAFNRLGRYLSNRMRNHPGQLEFVLGWFIDIGFALVGMILGTLLSIWLENILLESEFNYNSTLATLSFSTVFALMYVFSLRYLESIKQNSDLQVAKTELESRALKNQLDPHFLFNSLNTLSELFATDHEASSKWTIELAGIYRSILNFMEQESVTVKDELLLLNKYLSVEKLRFGRRLEYRINVSEDVQQAYIPPLILLTLVENSIKHGIEPRLDGGEIRVSAEKVGPHLFEFQVSNPLNEEPHYRDGTDTGLSNTRQRLELLHPKIADFKAVREDAQFLVAFKIRSRV